MHGVRRPARRGLDRPAVAAGDARGTSSARGQPLAFDLGAVSFCDVGGASFLAAVEAAHGEAAQLIGAQERVLALLHRARAARRPRAGSRGRPPATRARHHRAALRAAGRRASRSSARRRWRSSGCRARRRMLRMPDLLRYVDQAGVRSLPLVLMLGYLIGLILAFQSAVPMRRFGADIFVANLVAISLLRELGPLLAAVILAGRTGSAFAAEIGTMKVNEEVDALVTMGLDPMTMLVLPRMIAAMLVMPVMTLALDIAGMLGMATVMRGFGFPLVTIARQVQNWVTRRRPVWRAVQGGVLRPRGRGDRLPRRPRHRRRPARRRPVGDRCRGRRHRRHDRARRRVRLDLLSAEPVSR